MKKLIISLVCLMFFVQPAFSMGILQKNFEAEAERGKTVEFNVLFWNTENFGYPVTLSLIDASKDVYVKILPEEFYLNPENSYENFEYVARGNNYVKAFPVKILVKTFEDTEGKKDVYVKVLAGEKTNSTVTVFQEKTLIFSVNIKGSSSENKTFEKEAQPPALENKTFEIGEIFKDQKLFESIKNPLVIVSIILIILLAWRIYSI